MSNYDWEPFVSNHPPLVGETLEEIRFGKPKPGSGEYRECVDVRFSNNKSFVVFIPVEPRPLAWWRRRQHRRLLKKVARAA